MPCQLSHAFARWTVFPVTCARRLLRRYPDHKFMWFSDEKLFSVAVPVNTQSDRVFAHPTASRNWDINATRLIKTRSNFTKSAMVSVSPVSVPVTFTSSNQGSKSMQRTIATSFETAMLLPDIRATSVSEFFVFQQDIIPAHRANDTVALPWFCDPTRCLAA